MQVVYNAVRLFFRIVTLIFFREIDVVGRQHIPKKGPIIFVGNHQNQFVDGLLLLTNCRRSVRFLVATKSMKRAFIGFFASLMRSIPVQRRQDVKPVSGKGEILRLAPGPHFYKVDEIGDLSEESVSPLLSWGAASPKSAIGGRREDEATTGGGGEPILLEERDEPYDLLLGKGTQFEKELHAGDTVQVRALGRQAGRRRASDSNDDKVEESTGMTKERRRLSADGDGSADKKGKEEEDEEVVWVTLRVVKVFSNTVAFVDRKGVEKAGRQVGGSFRVTKKVDYVSMFAEVYTALAEGGAIVIFPEGGSHDRPELLPLKAGVAQMALGAYEENGVAPTIIPCGLNYFKGHRFRSQVVVEFGPPVKMEEEWHRAWKEGGREGQRQATASLLSAILSALQGVTLSAQSFDDLKVLYLSRRLYLGNSSSLGRSSSLVELFSATSGSPKSLPDALKVSHMLKDIFDRDRLLAQKDGSGQKILTLLDRVHEYGAQLKANHLKDKDIATQVGEDEATIAIESWFKVLRQFILKLVLLTIFLILGLPGGIINLPTILLTKYLAYREMRKAKAASSVKIKGKDVIASYKILVGMAVVPVNYCIQVLIGFWVYGGIGALVVLCLHPLISYATIKVGEEVAEGSKAPKIEQGTHALESLKRLLFALLPGGTKKRNELRRVRAELREEIRLAVKECVMSMGPEFWMRYSTLVAPNSITT